MNTNEMMNAAAEAINTNAGTMEFHLEEFSYKGVNLKGLHATAQAVITDERVRVEADATLKLIGHLLGEFGPSFAKLIEAEAEATSARRKLYEAQAAEMAVRAAKTCKCKEGK